MRESWRGLLMRRVARSPSSTASLAMYSGKSQSLPQDLTLAFGVEIRHQNRLLTVQQPANLFVNGMRGIFHHDVRIQAQLALRYRFGNKGERMFRRDGKDPANSANFGVINPAAVEQRVRCANRDIGLVVDNRIPDAVVDLGSDGDLTGRKLFFSTCSSLAVWRGVYNS